ncbi:MAG TPA: site-2 protease family protein [Bryobacteraceae bacterium]|nr:site-2 protease family protein [Bryobacteraceae bacterium]
MVPRLSVEALRAEFAFTRSTIGTRRLVLHAALFLATLLTATMAGVVFSQGYQAGRPIELEQYVSLVPDLWRNPALLLQGAWFSLPLMTILLAHEMGHYLACRYYRIDATLPFFLPAPTPIGTLGAFIRIQSPIYSKRALFDVGIAGPLAGFVMLVPALILGIAWSKIIPGVAEGGDLIFGVPLLQRLLEAVLLPGVGTANIYLHPLGRAAWVGILATALNLLPIGQLDGGHILYSFAGRWHRWLSRIFVAALVPMGLLYSRSWLVWAALLFFFGMRHPLIYDQRGIGAGRAWLGVAALMIFLLTFTLVPVR